VQPPADKNASNLGHRHADPVRRERGDFLQSRDVFVIGGSAGSIEALKVILQGLPPDFPASIFVTVHVPADRPSLLAKVLSDAGPLTASNPIDREDIQRGRIYVARPDHHLTIEDGTVRVLRGPRENRHRPAIDPLFRTAAREYGPRVVGVILSGLQDDGTAGLYAVKQRDGLTIVQDPNDALWSDMPKRAIEYVAPHTILGTREIAPTLIKLANGQEGETAMTREDSVSRKSNGRNKQQNASGGLERPDANEETAYSDEGKGVPFVFACPECHGTLWELKDEQMVRFRCRVGHSYGTESLTRELSVASETALWAAVRALEEKAALQRRVAEKTGIENAMPSRLLDQSSADAANARLIREMIFRRDAELQREEIESERQQRTNTRKTA